MAIFIQSDFFIYKLTGQQPCPYLQTWWCKYGRASANAHVNCKCWSPLKPPRPLCGHASDMTAEWCTWTAGWPSVPQQWTEQSQQWWPRAAQDLWEVDVLNKIQGNSCHYFTTKNGKWLWKLWTQFKETAVAILQQTMGTDHESPMSVSYLLEKMLPC